jgi:hypothetical protein
MKPRVPVHLASMHWESLTNEFLTHYADDDRFVNALRRLARKHRATCTRRGSR